MTALPSGTITFLFTDVEGSSSRWEHDRAAMTLAMRRHDELVRAAVTSHGGHVFKTVGDAFYAAFTTATDALAAAIAAQRALVSQEWSGVDDLRVRMALHTGVADERDADYFGPPLNRVARLLSIAHGGQVLLSGITAGLVRDTMPPGAALQPLGAHRLRDLSDTENVYQLLAPDLPEAFPPLRSVNAYPNNLPTQSTRFIGRDDVVSDIKSFLEKARLETIVGAGGVGKTRTALAVAAEMLDRFDDGVWFVELAPVSDPGLVPGAIAATLGVRESPARPLRDALVDYVKRRRMLLVLDNCEHVVGETARMVDAFLRASPELRIIATSREALNVSGEHRYRMPSLSFPPSGMHVDASGAQRFEAIVLFAERARAANPAFALTDANARHVAEICRRLDGIALAIELAAARVRVLGVEDLSRRLDERFRILTGGDRTALPRQQTMRALIDWSYDLLAEGERRLLQQASFFAGDWTLEAAEVVCASGADGEVLDAMDVLDLISSLVEKSLIVHESDAARYRLLESTRAYALEKLTAAGAYATTAGRHAAWVADFVVDRSESYWWTPVQSWLGGIMPEVDNIRAALVWSLGTGGDALVGGRIAGSLEGLWYNGGLYGEGRRWIRTALDRIDETEHPGVVASLWLTLARVSFAKGMVDAAERAIALFDRLNESRCLGNSYHMLAVGLRRMGRLAEAEDAIDRSLAYFREARATNAWPFLLALDVRAGILRYRGHFAEARALRVEALTRLEALGDDFGAATPRVNLAELEFEQGNASAAVELAETAATTYRAARDEMMESTAMINASEYRLALGEFDAASEETKRALEIARRVQWSQGIAIAIQNLAAVAAARADTERAARLLGYVDAWYRSESFEREPTEHSVLELTLAMLRERLPDERVSELRAQGANLNEERAADDAAAV